MCMCMWDSLFFLNFLNCLVDFFVCVFLYVPGGQ